MRAANYGPSRWIKDYHTKDLTKYMLGCGIVTTTRQPTVVTLSDDWEQLQELIWRLHTEGMESKEISNHLNSGTIKLRKKNVFRKTYLEFTGKIPYEKKEERRTSYQVREYWSL